RGSAMVKKYGKVDFEDLFTGDTPSIGAAAYVVGPINFLLRNAFEDVDIEGLNLEIEASEQSKSATLERVWIDGHAEGADADLSRRGDHPCGAGRDSGERAWQRLDHGHRRDAALANGSA